MTAVICKTSQERRYVFLTSSYRIRRYSRQQILEEESSLSSAQRGSPNERRRILPASLVGNLRWMLSGYFRRGKEQSTEFRNGENLRLGLYGVETQCTRYIPHHQFSTSPAAELAINFCFKVNLSLRFPSFTLRTMESLAETVWDVVICGTGLQQSLLAL